MNVASFSWVMALRVFWLGCTAVVLGGCTPLGVADAASDAASASASYDYIIGPGDELGIFVWRNPEISVEGVAVGPDGKISVPLVEDLPASGKTSSQLAREIEQSLSVYVKDPQVTVTVGGFQGVYDKQIRVVGQAATPQALAYRANMTVLDVMIQVGGLTEFAAGNRARIVRRVGGEQREMLVRLDDLVKDGDIGANVSMVPGDILIIPESWF